MSITSEKELKGMQAISDVVGMVLREMIDYAKPGMSTKKLDEYGRLLLQGMGAKSAPILTYDFPGWSCISVNHEVAHGVPTEGKILDEGDLVNIDVSAELNGFWSDNGCSFVLGEDKHNHQPLVDHSKRILHKAIAKIKSGVRIAEVGRVIENEARKSGYGVIRNLAGHGIGKSLHEAPHEIYNFYDRFNQQRFRAHSVVAIETFISTRSNIAEVQKDGWTLVGNKGGYTAQHEHTIIVTENEPIILTASNGI
ncbi:MAG: type I methionyl aminopeptidase [Bacteroidota bacterium]